MYMSKSWFDKDFFFRFYQLTCLDSESAGQSALHIAFQMEYRDQSIQTQDRDTLEPTVLHISQIIMKDKKFLW